MKKNTVAELLILCIVIILFVIHMTHKSDADKVILIFILIYMMLRFSKRNK